MGWFLGLPALCGGIIIYLCRPVSPSTNTHVYALDFGRSAFWLVNLALGLVEWFAFLLPEPFVILAARGMRRLQSSPSENAASRSWRE